MRKSRERECSGKRQLRDAKLQQLAHTLCSLELNLSGTELGSLLLYTPAVNVVGEAMGEKIMQTTIRLNTQFHEIWLLVI